MINVSDRLELFVSPYLLDKTEGAALKLGLPGGPDLSWLAGRRVRAMDVRNEADVFSQKFC